MRENLENREESLDVPFWLETADGAADEPAGRPLLRCAVLAAILFGAGRAAQALPPPIAIPVVSSAPVTGFNPFGFVNGIGHSGEMLGDLWGLRRVLSRYGMALAVQETSEYLGNVSGGVKQGFEYEGLTQAVLQLNTQRAFGWYGGLFNASALQIHGHNLSADNLGTLQTASGIEADRGTRLWELWYDQKLLEENRLDIKIGQQSLDQEFIVSSNASYFVNTMFGWPMVPSADLPGGGPAYPLSAPGARVLWKPVNSLNVLAGAFDGSPVPRGESGDPQKLDASGTSFPIHGGALYIAELQYLYPSLGEMVYSDEPALSGTYRLGAWYDNEHFDDLRYDDNGLSLADPSSDGVPASHEGDYSVYAVADQMVYRSDVDPNRTMSVFARAMGTPESDRNSVDFSMNAGLVLHDPFRYRTDDIVGLGTGYAHVSRAVAGLAADTGVFNPGSYNPQPHGETFVEAFYQRLIFPWLQVQPDAQYVIRPGGGVANPNASSNELIKNELVVGMRAIIQL